VGSEQEQKGEVGTHPRKGAFSNPLPNAPPPRGQKQLAAKG
jgi:hypothetical protein